MVKVEDDIILYTKRGSRDDTYVYQDGGDDYYVLNINRSLPYVGLEHFNRASSTVKEIPDARDDDLVHEALESLDDVFLQGNQVSEVFDSYDRFDDLGADEIRDVLLDYI